jgi:hypothetical protein
MVTKFKVVEFYRNNNSNFNKSDLRSFINKILGFSIIGGYQSVIPATCVGVVTERQNGKKVKV